MEPESVLSGAGAGAAGAGAGAAGATGWVCCWAGAGATGAGAGAAGDQEVQPESGRGSTTGYAGR